MARNKFDIDETLETPFDVKHLKRSFIYIGKYKKKIALSLFLSAISIIVSLMSPMITKEALDVAMPTKDVKWLCILGVLLLLTIIVSVILARIRSEIMTKVGQSIVFDIREDLFKKLQELSFEYYDTRPHGKILVRVINYINSISDLMTNGLINFILEIFNLIFITIFMFFISWRLALVILGGVPIFVVFVLFIKNKQRRAWQAVSNKSSNLNAYLHEGIAGAGITKLFTREEVNGGIFKRLSGAFRDDWMVAVKYSNMMWPVVNFLQLFVRCAIYVFGLIAFVSFNITFGTIMAMADYANRFWQPIINLSSLMNTFINSVAYLERIFETLDEKVDVKDAENAKIMPEIKGDVEFRDVTFAYDESAVILENLSFKINAGESIALVGPTGAGKTTIVNLISRFYNLNGGEILIDGENIADVTLKSLRSQMGIMLQDSFIFSGTLMTNLKYGRLDATEVEVMNACKIVGIHDYIMSLKDGYETIVKERGSGLSQGQKQLIAFARTILANPKILVLDEATSSIDAKTERNLQNGINYLLKGRTSFIIAHRLSTIRNCDKIMYVSNKGITECGTHDELIAKRGDYYNLYTAQAV